MFWEMTTGSINFLYARDDDEKNDIGSESHWAEDRDLMFAQVKVRLCLPRCQAKNSYMNLKEHHTNVQSQSIFHMNMLSIEMSLL